MQGRLQKRLVSIALLLASALLVAIIATLGPSLVFGNPSILAVGNWITLPLVLAPLVTICIANPLP